MKVLIVLYLISTVINIPWNNQRVFIKSDVKLQGSSATPEIICQDISDKVINVYEGNTIDAAIAGAICSGVVDSYASGIGGGGFMLIKPNKLTWRNESVQIFDENGLIFKKTDPVLIDCRETAPAASTYDMLLAGDELKKLALSIGVPGELYCFETAHKIWGKLPWKKLFEDSINLAWEGFPVQRNLAWRISKYLPKILSDPILKEIYAPEGRGLVDGETCYRRRYAAALENIAENGIKSFYAGEYAESIVKTVQSKGGILTLEDLKNYKPILKRPLEGQYRDYKVTTGTTPGSGGILLSMLNIAENFNVSKIDAESTHVLIESIKFGTAQKSILGDYEREKDVLIDQSLITSKETGRKNSLRVNLKKTYDKEYYSEKYFNDVEEHGTCHISVLGKFGNLDEFEAVSITTTINWDFGSWILDPLTGTILNNQLYDFSKPNVEDAVGRITNPRNYPSPGRRPLSSMVPTIMESNMNTHVIVIGGSGGRKIFSSVFLSAISILDWQFDSKSAVTFSRFYHPLNPNVIEFEPSWLKDEKLKSIVNDLKSKDHNITILKDYVTSLVQVVQFRNNQFDSAADPRLDFH
ncbi:hypothetical protein HDU92_006041 [Lobulomyces angularis]|nr:hypothetical protein HDU92_006041 [Lobulomyces angularis]